jgi:hypothetical protein
MVRKFWFIILIALVALACNVSQPKSQEPTQEAVSGAAPAEPIQPEAEVEQAEAPAAASPTETPAPTPTQIPSNPIGLWEGLSSLNSYRLQIQLLATGPTAQDKNQLTYTIEAGSDGDSSHISSETVSSSADDPEESRDISETYRVGESTCDLSGDSSDISVTDEDPMAKEMLSTWAKLVDLVPRVNDPVFIGEEEVNGIQTNHFQFTVSGLGVDSGAEVVSSSGDYWLAQDGQYIVKYYTVLETRNGPAGDPETKTMRTEFSISLQDANQNIVITMPEQCQ